MTIRRESLVPRRGRRAQDAAGSYTTAGAPGRLPLLGLDLAAVAVGVLAVVHPPAPDPDHAGIAAAVVLVLAGVVHTEIVRVLDRRRRLAVRRPHVDAAATWSVAAVLLLPLPGALLVTALVSADAWWRSWQRRPARFGLATVAAAVLASAGSGLLLTVLPADGRLHETVAVAVALAGLTRWALHALLVMVLAAAAPVDDPDARRLPATRVELLLSGAATVVGLAAAEIAVRSPWVLGVLVLPLAAIHREAQLHELQRLASTDEKTDLVTAAAWRRRAQRLLARAQRRRGGPCAVGVLMIDLDEFKAVNDRHGHLVGDAVLGAVARAVRAELRPVDLAGRFGGEEFVVALADLDPRDALERSVAVAERIRRRVPTVAVELEGAGVLTDLTVSIGVAVHPEDGGTLEELVLAADAALYTAKRSGRDRVCRAGEETAA